MQQGGIKVEVPEVSLPDFLLTRLGHRDWGDKPCVVDVNTDTRLLFRELEPHSRRLASALHRLGLTRGDVLFFVTGEMAPLCVLQLAVWRLGGAVRGGHPATEPEELARQMAGCRFVLVDATTAPRVLSAQLEAGVRLLSTGGDVESATSLQQLLLDDGQACPPSVQVAPRKDVVAIVSTSGSTGRPKGVLHTHYTTVAMLCNMQATLPTDSVMESSSTAAISNFGFGIHAMASGCTLYHVGVFEQANYFDLLSRYRPSHVVMYPLIASWLARCEDQLAAVREEDFLRSVMVGGWVLDRTTAALLAQRLPRCRVRQLYGSTECMFMSLSSDLTHGVDKEGRECVSSGELVPGVQAKVIDPGSGRTLELGERGEILIRSPQVYLGYLTSGDQPDRSDVDPEGWYHSGDIGFLDHRANIFVTERLTFMFKHRMLWVSPSEVEEVLQEHPAVQLAGVVGVPDPHVDTLACGLVVLRPDCSASPAELEHHVAQRLPPHKRLHGGVRLVDHLPQNRAGKLDRGALMLLARQPVEQ